MCAQGPCSARRDKTKITFSPVGIGIAVAISHPIPQCEPMSNMRKKMLASALASFVPDSAGALIRRPKKRSKPGRRLESLLMLS
jgi:hypothetical protein